MITFELTRNLQAERDRRVLARLRTTDLRAERAPADRREGGVRKR